MCVHVLLSSGVADRLYCRGIGLTAADAKRTPEAQWGENLLGKALDEVRRQLREGGAADDVAIAATAAAQS